MRLSRLAYGVETGSEISVPAGNVADAFGQLENLTQLGRDVDLVAKKNLLLSRMLAFENDTCGVSS